MKGTNLRRDDVYEPTKTHTFERRECVGHPDFGAIPNSRGDWYFLQFLLSRVRTIMSR